MDLLKRVDCCSASIAIDICPPPGSIDVERKTTTRAPGGDAHPVDHGTRRALGKYYTNPAIADFLVSRLDGISEEKMVLDPACGAGELLASYASALAAAMVAKGASEARIREAIAARVWGFDVDPGAVELCKARLAGDGNAFPGQTMHVYHVDAIDMQASACMRGGNDQGEALHEKQFDYVIGNPPFFVVDKEKQPFNRILTQDNYQAIDTENLNVASMFLHRYLHSLLPGGQLAFIFPRSVLHVQSFSKLRREILTARLQAIFDLGKAFENVGLEQCILVIQHASNEGNVVHYALLGNEGGSISEVVSYGIPQAYLATTPDAVFEVFSGAKPGATTTWAALKAKIEARAAGNGIMQYCTAIQRGIGLQREASRTRQSPGDIMVLGGRSIFNYGKKGIETCRFLPEGRIVKARMTGKDRANLHSPKILLQNLVSSRIRIVGCYDDDVQRADAGADGDRYAMSFDTITNLYLHDQRHARFLLAVLTSELVTCFLRDVVFVRATLTIHLDRKYLEKIPIPHPTATQLDGITAAVVELERFSLEHQQREPARERDVPAWEDPAHPDHPVYARLTRAMNDLVYDLYGITNAERRFIEAQLREFDEYY